MHRFYLSSRVLGSSTFTGWKEQMEIENLKCRKEQLTGGPKLQRRLKGKAEVWGFASTGNGISFSGT